MSTLDELDDGRLLELASDPAQRTREYRQLVPAYYARITDSYRKTWGDSFHFGLFDGEATREEAIRATEVWLGERARIHAGMRALDVGCGIGGPTMTVAQLTGAHVTGVDIVPRHVRIARERARDAGLSEATAFHLADGMDLPFKDGAFDAVLVSESGCYMPAWDRFVRECRRVLRPGGRFVGVDWAQAAEVPDARSREAIEEVCRWHAIPALQSADTIRSGLERAAMQVEIVEPVQSHVERNHARLYVVRPDGMPLSTTLTAWRMLSAGGRAIGEAARAGCFLLVRWSAVAVEAA